MGSVTENKSGRLTPVLVTGSGQHSLLDRLAHNFPGMFQRERMVTAFDVKYGKPNPEPYLMGLEKAGVKANEAIVVENAPIGVQAGAAAGIIHNRCQVPVRWTDKCCWMREPICYSLPCKLSAITGKLCGMRLHLKSKERTILKIEV